MTSALVPEVVFAGRSSGKGELRLGLGQKQPFAVASLGTLQGDGRFRLEQEVRFGDKPARKRSWMMWQTSPGHYSATLSDAAGPVTLAVEGSRLTLRYPVNHWGLVMHQTLDLARDGRTVRNAGSLRFLGIPVGQLQETIHLQR